MNNEQTTSDDTAAERIDVNQTDSVQAWAEKLDTTPAQIQEAVRAVGDLAADVEMHLKGTHATTNADQEARADATDDAP